MTPPTGIDRALAEFAPPKPRRRQSQSPHVWRVRGWNGDVIVHSRVYQRRAPAIENLRAAQNYYDRVTLEIADVGEFTGVEVKPWW